MIDARQVWLQLHLGVPKGLAYGLVKNPTEHADSDTRDWGSALDDTQESDANWDATPTVWRRAPKFFYPDVIAATTASLSGRDATIGGVTWNLDEAGRTVGFGESLPPDGTLNDQTAAVVLAETVARDLEFTEKGTRQRVKVWASQDPATPVPEGFDAALYRQSSDSLVVRV